jgi:hypothetical protein
MYSFPIKKCTEPGTLLKKCKIYYVYTVSSHCCLSVKRKDEGEHGLMEDRRRNFTYGQKTDGLKTDRQTNDGQQN